MSKWIPLIVLAVLAIGASFYFMRGEKTQDFEVLENGEQLPTMEKRPDAQTVTLRGLDRNTGGSKANPGSASSRAERTSMGPDIKVAVAGGEFQVLLMDPKRQVPLEGMHVFLLDRETLGPNEWRQVGSNLRDLRKMVKDRGVEQISDADGLAHFQRVLDGAIWAEGEGWQGYYDWIGPPESPLALSLRAHSELEVVVLDEDGHPVPQVPLSILSMAPGQWVALIKRTTPNSGAAQFPGVSNLVHRGSSESPLAVAFHFPHEPRVWQEIDPEWLPEDPIEMRIPPSAPLTIRVVDGEGLPFEGTFMVDLGVPSDTEGERVSTILSMRANMGEVTFPFVGLGAPIRVQLSGSKDLKPKIVDFRGPTMGEEDAVREVAWFEKHLVVSGLAKGPGGSLLNRRIQASWGGGRSQRSIPVVTDANGAFSVTMNGEIGSYLHLNATAQGNEPSSTAAVPLPSPLPNGEWNAGVVSFEGDPLFAEGQVFNVAGVPIAGARVMVESWHRGAPSGGGKGEERGVDGKGPAQVGGSKDLGGSPKRDEKSEESDRSKKADDIGSWTQAGRLFAISDERGRFKIYGKSFSQRLRLRAIKPEYLDQSIENVTAGMPPVYFNLQEGVQIRANETIQSSKKR